MSTQWTCYLCDARGHGHYASHEWWQHYLAAHEEDWRPDDGEQG